jgi:hypothetical protein
MQNKDLKDIRPAKGVRTQEKELKRPVGPPQIQKNVIPDNNTQEPTEDALKLINEIRNNKDNLLSAMRNFNLAMRNKTLPENFSEADKNKDKAVIDELIVSAQNIEKYSLTEGYFALFINLLRGLMNNRDERNKLEFEIQTLKKRVLSLENGKNYDPAEEKKMELYNMAKELGIKIKIED